MSALDVGDTSEDNDGPVVVQDEVDDGLQVDVDEVVQVDVVVSVVVRHETGVDIVDKDAVGEVVVVTLVVLMSYLSW